MTGHDPLHDLFERAAPPSVSPAQTRQTLDELRPGFVGAHRRHRRRLGAAVAAATFAVAGGATALGSIGSSSTDDLGPRTDPAPETTIGDADEIEDALPVDVVPDDTLEIDRSEVDPPEMPTAIAPPLDDSTSPTDTEAHEESPGSDDESDEADEDADRAPSTTTEPDEPTPTTTASPVVGTHTASSAGGSVTVDFDGETITVVSIDPATGFTADLAEEKPHEVKVYFRDGTDEYEVEIKVEEGELRIDEEY